MVTTANVISYAISILAVLITIFSLVKTSTKEDSSALTSLIVKMETIKDICKDTQTSIRNIQDDVKQIDKRVTRLEAKMEDGLDGR